MKTKFWYWVIFGIMLLNIAVYVILPASQRTLAVWDNIWEVISMGLASIFLFHASKYGDDLEKKGLKLLSFAFSFWTLGQVLWSVFESTNPNLNVPFPSASDIFFLGFYAFAFLGIFTLLRHSIRTSSYETEKRTFEISYLIILFSLLSPVLFAPFLLIEASIQEKLIAIAYPFLDFIIIAIFTIFVSLEQNKLNNPWIDIEVGFLLLFIANTLFLYDTFGFSLKAIGSFSYIHKYGLLWTLSGLHVAIGTLKYTETKLRKNITNH